MFQIVSWTAYAGAQMVLVPLDTPGITVERMLPVFGAYDEPYGHGQVLFDNVRLPKSAIIAGPGRGFEIAQGRLGPGRVHHCMRAIGAAERTLEIMIKRAMTREAFGRPIAKLGGNPDIIANARMNIEQARLLTLKCAWALDTKGIMGALQEVSMIKAVVPKMLQQIVDDAIASGSKRRGGHAHLHRAAGAVLHRELREELLQLRLDADHRRLAQLEHVRVPLIDPTALRWARRHLDDARDRHVEPGVRGGGAERGAAVLAREHPEHRVQRGVEPPVRRVADAVAQQRKLLLRREAAVGRDVQHLAHVGRHLAGEIPRE